MQGSCLRVLGFDWFCQKVFGDRGGENPVAAILLILFNNKLRICIANRPARKVRNFFDRGDWLERILKKRGGNGVEEGRMKVEKLVRPREVARRLAVSRSTIYRWFWEGKLRGVRLRTGSLRILAASVEEMVAEVW